MSEKKIFKHNTLNIKELWTSLKTRVFATNFAVGDLHASYERHFVKKIQHLLSLKTAFHQCYKCCLVDGVLCAKSLVQSTNREEECLSHFCWFERATLVCLRWKIQPVKWLHFVWEPKSRAGTYQKRKKKASKEKLLTGSMRFIDSSIRYYA